MNGRRNEGGAKARLLAEVCELELAERQRRRGRRVLRPSHLPSGNTLDTFDFPRAKGLERGRPWPWPTNPVRGSKPTIVLLLGPSGRGKSPLASAIGHALAEQALAVRSLSATVLVQHLQQARQALILPAALSKLDRYRRLIIEDLAYIVFALLCNANGCPLAVEVFEGNTADPKTVATQLDKLRERFGLKRVVLVADRGRLTEARLREDLKPLQGIDWVSCVTGSSHCQTG